MESRPAGVYAQVLGGFATYDIAVTDAGGHRVGTSRLTCLIRDQAHDLNLNGAGELDER